MADVKIRVMKNGPYEVEGAVDLVDQKRNAYKTADDAVYLCRCGQSAKRPFCDGTHNTNGFKAEETAD